jgi:TusA-related sulfurtransferase
MDRNKLMETISLIGIPCPENAARALLTLATSDSGSEIVFTVDNGEPLKNLMDALALEGFCPVLLKSLGSFSEVKAKVP